MIGSVDKINEEKIIYYIMSTKKHFENIEYSDNDLNIFLDFDLSGLGYDWNNYSKNTSEIKYEFCHHLRDIQWNEGRRKFLQSVMVKEKIFRTNYFFENFETKAKENLIRELHNTL